MITVAVLVTVLSLMTLSDLRWRRIPRPLGLACGGLVIGHGIMSEWPVALVMSGAVFGWLGAWLGGLPGGDRLAFVTVGMLLGPWHMIGVLIMLYLTLLSMLAVFGSSYSFVTWPMMPLLSSSTMVVIWVMAPPHFNMWSNMGH